MPTITFDWSQLWTVLVAYVPIFFYSLSEAIKGIGDGEKFSFSQFLKTMLISFITAGVGAGLVTQYTSDVLLAVALPILASTVITVPLDKFFNLFMEDVYKTAPIAKEITKEDIEKLIETINRLVPVPTPPPPPPG